MNNKFGIALQRCLREILLPMMFVIRQVLKISTDSTQVYYFLLKNLYISILYTYTLLQSTVNKGTLTNLNYPKH